MSGLTEEQETKLAQINSTEGGKNFSSSQKAVVVKFGTIPIKAGEKQFGETEAPKQHSVPAKREKEWPTIETPDETELKATYE